MWPLRGPGCFGNCYKLWTSDTYDICSGGCSHISQSHRENTQTTIWALLGNINISKNFKDYHRWVILRLVYLPFSKKISCYFLGPWYVYPRVGDPFLHHLQWKSLFSSLPNWLQVEGRCPLQTTMKRAMLKLQFSSSLLPLFQRAAAPICFSSF